MQLLDDQLQTQVRQTLSPITQPVELVVFKGSALFVPGQDAAGMQDETLALLREVAECSDKLSVVERSLSDPEAQALGLTHAPTILLREAGSDRSNIRFIGLPAGYEFTTLLETILMLGTGEAKLGERTLAEVKKIDSPVRMQSFVTPTCPYCPHAVLTAFKFAYHNPKVLAEGIEANEFPVLSSQFGISGVPDTIITGSKVERVLGGQPDRVFLEAALRATEVAA